MKYIICIGAFATISAEAFIANIETIPSPSGDPTVPFVDNAGVPLPFGTGGVRLGYFTIDDAAVSASPSYTDLMTNNFVQFTTDTIPVGANLSGTQVPGLLVNESMTAPITASNNNDFVGKSMYVVVSLNNTFDDSDSIAVFRTDGLFDLDGSANQNTDTASVAGPLTASNLLIGADGGGVEILGTNFSQSIQLVAVPEPSTSLLSVLTIIGFAFKRRR